MKRGRPSAWETAKKYQRNKKPRTTPDPRKRIVPGYTRSVGNYGRYNQRLTGLGPEKKFFDTALNFNFDLTGEVPATGQLCLIPQGDTESTRDGRQAIIKSVQIRGTITLAPGANATSTAVAYLYLVLDTQCNGAAAAITDVFTGTGMNTNMLELNNSGRFRIIKRWVKQLSSHAGVTTAYNSQIIPVEYYKSCNIPIDWNGTTGAITEIRSNNLFLCAGATNDDLCTFAGSCRLRFMG